VPACIHKFDEFELDPSRFELRRNGRVLKLERIPMELLLLLLEKDGSVVTRQEIVDHLWGKDVFVDTEHGINTAIRKIRQALKDDPDRPRFVQTVTGKGYRFVAEKNDGKPEPPQSMEGRTPRKPALSEVEGSGDPEVPGRSLTTTDTTEIKPAPVSFKKFKLTAAIALCLFAASALTFLFRNRIFPNQTAQIHSIAVLPLTNLSGDSSQEYFADGMTDELITALAKNRNLRVVSRTSVMQYKGVNRPVRDIARELGVDGILEGSVERSASRVHMTVQLIYAPTDTHLWAQSYNRDETQALSLPEELSQIVAKEVKITTSAAPRPRYISPEAHDAYLHGRYFWFTFNKAPQALPYFEKAIQLQPDYAAAWSGLADTYMLSGMNGDTLPLDMMPKAEAAVRKALELDDSLPQAHESMGAWYLFCAWDLPRAETEARRGVELDPNDSQAHLLLSSVFEAENRSAEALAEQKRSAELDPFVHPWEVGRFLTDAGHYDAAIDEFRMQSRVRPNDSEMVDGLAKVYWLKGMYKESQQELEKSLEMQHNSKDLAAVHKAWLHGGEKAVEQWGANNVKALARHEYIQPFYIATIIAYTGDKDETLKYLEAAYREHSPNMVSLQTESLFGFLHSDPRFQSLVKKVGLPPAP